MNIMPKAHHSPNLLPGDFTVHLLQAIFNVVHGKDATKESYTHVFMLSLKKGDAKFLCQQLRGSSHSCITATGDCTSNHLVRRNVILGRKNAPHTYLILSKIKLSAASHSPKP